MAEAGGGEFEEERIGVMGVFGGGGWRGGAGETIPDATHTRDLGFPSNPKD